MKLFVDSANVTEIEECLKRGFVSGITTNPSLLGREKQHRFDDVVYNIIDRLNRYNMHVPLSVELTTTTVPEMIMQGTNFKSKFDYKEIVIKVPIGWDELEVITTLKATGAKINCTCVMSYNQAIIAANAGADYVSIFWGRIRDTGFDAATVVNTTARSLQSTDCKIIVGSIRQMIDVNEAIQAGADIVTVPPKFFNQMTQHFKTDEVISQFMNDYRIWSTHS